VVGNSRMVGDVLAAARISPLKMMQTVRKSTRRHIGRFRRLLSDWLLDIVPIMLLLS